MLATLSWGGGLGEVRAADDAPTARIAGVGTVAGFSSGISGAGWGPIGVKLLILLRIEPRSAIGSSLVGRVFMALAAVAGYLLAATALQDVRPDYPLIVVLFAGSVAAMVPGAFLLSRLGRETATIAITILSIHWRCRRSSGADRSGVAEDLLAARARVDDLARGQLQPFRLIARDLRPDRYRRCAPARPAPRSPGTRRARPAPRSPLDGIERTSMSCGRTYAAPSRLTGPMKHITNSLAGCSYSSRGEPSCSILPWSMTTMRSATSMASSWSWVTNTVVTWVSSCSRRNQCAELLAHSSVQRAEGLVQQQHLGLDGERPRKRHPLALPAR